MSSYLFLFFISMIINFCFGAIWHCDNDFDSMEDNTAKHEEYPWDYGSEHCADEGGRCQGPGRIFYGAELTWTYKDIGEGESIPCSNEGFGCDPLWLFRKSCYRLYYQDGPKCTFNVLSVDHVSGTIGKYFNFDISTVSDILGRPFETGNYYIFNSRTITYQNARMWSNNNGGSNGDGHGRYKVNAQSGDWQTGDVLAFLTPEVSNLACTDWPSSDITKTMQDRCEWGNTGHHDGYFYVYNMQRFTSNAECGVNSNCWCCRALIPENC